MDKQLAEALKLLLELADGYHRRAHNRQKKVYPEFWSCPARKCQHAAQVLLRYGIEPKIKVEVKE